MSDETQQPVFQIQRVYVKDMSLEQPNSPAIFLENEPPKLEVAVDVGADVVADGVYESTVTITLTAKIKEKVAFLVECKQAGIFEVRNIPSDQLDPLLGIACPNILYPYLRANIADAVTRAGFPPVHLAEINFDAYYQKRVELAIEAAKAAGQAPSQPSGLVMPDGSAATLN
ncbi:MAG: protein-export chaperone SecB [Burkholderiaceae bacterium]|nr:protein-export chaperone SecB [Burkholderiaceae bacterium]